MPDSIESQLYTGWFSFCATGTRKDDIVVDAGAPILLMLTTPFVL